MKLFLQNKGYFDAQVHDSIVLKKNKVVNVYYIINEGKPYTIRYSGCDDGCTIILQNGPSDDLSDYKTLTSMSHHY